MNKPMNITLAVVVAGVSLRTTAPVATTRWSALLVMAGSISLGWE